jgi:acyl carrier protein
MDLRLMSTPAYATRASSGVQVELVLGAMEDFFKQVAPGALSSPLTAETRMLGSGLLDSLSMLQLTTHLSEAFGVEFEDDDFTEENFVTAGRIAALISAKLARSG